MANIHETTHWTETIYEIATTDDVVGGPEGISNIQATQLASRTNFLKEQANSLGTQINDLESGQTAAGKATQLATPRLIQLSGDATGSAAFDGSANIVIALTQKDNGISPGSYRQVFVDSKGRVVDGLNPTTLAGYGIVDAAPISYVQQHIFPAGTRMPFAQAAAPIGWTQINDDSTNNRMLRVVNGYGGNYGGYHHPVINNVVPPHSHVFTTGGISADHTHSIHDPGHAHAVYDPGHYHDVPVRARNSSGAGFADSGDKITHGSMTNGAATGIAIYASGTGVWASGVTSDHHHSGATDNGSSQTNWEPRYIDLIICIKN